MSDYNELIKELRDAMAYAGSTGNNPYRYVPYYEAAAYAIEELQARLWIAEKRTEEATPHWISVKERLPDKQGEPYLCAITYRNGERAEVILWYDAETMPLFWNRFFVPHGAVTHWMPLPELPKEEDNG